MHFLLFILLINYTCTIFFAYLFNSLFKLYNVCFITPVLINSYYYCKEHQPVQFSRPFEFSKAKPLKTEIVLLFEQLPTIQSSTQ